jgi:hypothetical protein
MRILQKNHGLFEVNFVDCEQLISQVKKYAYIRLVCSLSSYQIGFLSAGLCFKNAQ